MKIPIPASRGGRYRSIGARALKIVSKNLDSDLAALTADSLIPVIQSVDLDNSSGASAEKSVITSLSAPLDDASSPEVSRAPLLAEALGAGKLEEGLICSSIVKKRMQEESGAAGSSEISPAPCLIGVLGSVKYTKKRKERGEDLEIVMFWSKVRIGALSLLILIVSVMNLLLTPAILSRGEAPRYPGLSPT